MQRDFYNLIFFTGIAAIICAWLTIAISIHFNPWFRINVNALSDLGGGNFISNGHPAPTYPFIYNGGLMVTALLVFSFSVLSISHVNSKVEIMGLSFFIISALFLALIGIYHEGTYPHAFVSIWFFILSSISFVTIGIGMYLVGDKKFGITIILIILASWIVYSSVRWGSVAEGEVFGISVIDIVVSIYLANLAIVRAKKVRLKT
ncbi:DUF998 domain-containing protein [Thermoplasma volcanium]|nr:DUF998 domain-containing protein [Thermoplasma volcanium]